MTEPTNFVTLLKRYRQAVGLSQEALAALREQAQTPLPPAEQGAFEHMVATAKTALSEPAFKEEWTTGTKLTHDQAIDYALSESCT